MKKHIILLASAMVTLGAAAQPQEETKALVWSALHNLDYEVNAGLNIGGTTPLPIPAEIRKIDKFNPNLNLSIGGKVTKWYGNDARWGTSLGIYFETKGMQTNATVKNYGMTIIQDGSEISGRWTGKVKTEYTAYLFTVPINAVFRINNRLKVFAGPYFSVAMSSNFQGYVHDGYLREGDPTGNKVTFEGDAEAAYDFSNELRTFQWGLDAGISWLAFKHLSVSGTLSWGLNNIFKSSFKTVDFNMYPVYFNVGFGYVF